MSYIRAQAGQVITAQMINATTGADYVGTVTVNVTIDNQPKVAGAGTVTSELQGEYQYAIPAAEIDGAVIAYQFVGSGAISVVLNVPTISPGQQSSLGTATGLLAVPILTIITDAFAALNIYGANELPSPEDAELARGLLNTIFDDWNAERPAVYCEQFLQFTLVPALSPHTIGPTGTFVVSQRPESIETINWINNGIYTEIPVSIDPSWYQSISMPGLSTAIPLGCYYEKNWPNGKLFFWPVPATAYVIEMMARVILGSVLLTDTFSMPPGYRSAVTLTLEEALVPAFPGALSSEDGAKLIRAAAKSRARVFGNNVVVPKLATRDSGMPSGGPRGSMYYNYKTGQFN